MSEDGDKPVTPAGRFSLVADLAREGKITADQARLLLEMPTLSPEQLQRVLNLMLHPVTFVRDEPTTRTTEQLFAIVAEVAAKHALATRTKVRVDLCYEADRTPSFARVRFGDKQDAYLDIDVAPSGAALNLDAYRQLVEADIERFRWRNRRPAA